MSKIKEPTSSTFSSPVFYGWVGLLIVLMAVGAYAWSLELTIGHEVTGLSDIAPWGLFVANYIFCIGASAGGFIIAAITHIFGIERYKPISRMAVAIAIVLIILPPIFIFADLGHVERIGEFLITPNPTSMLVWVMITLTSYLVLLLVELWFSVRADLVKRRSWLAFGSSDISEKALGRDMKVLIALSAIGLPLAVSVHSVTGWIFGLVKARPMWYTGIMAPIFLSSALVSGLAVLIFVIIGASRFAAFKVEKGVISDIAKILAALIPIDLFLLFCEFFTAGYGAEPFHIEALTFFLTGPIAPLAWTEIVVGGIIPFFLLVHPRVRQSIPVVTIASFLVVIGIWLKRINLLVSGLAYSMQYAIIGLGPVVTYVPTWVEWAVMAGIFAFGALLLTLGIKLLPLSVEEVKK